MKVDAQILHAYLDGELGEQAAQRVEAAIAADPRLRAELQAQERLRDQLSAHFDPVLDEPVPERFSGLLEPKVVDLSAARTRLRLRGWLMPLAMAASLVFGIAIGQLVPSAGSFDTVDGVLVARGALAEALDVQLASTQPSDAAIRIGVSFARADGTLCRTFASAGNSGLACREGNSWRMIATAAAPESQRGDYRQAATEAQLVLQAAQEMMSGEPLDAAAETRARSMRWRLAR